MDREISADAREQAIAGAGVFNPQVYRHAVEYARWRIQGTGVDYDEIVEKRKSGLKTYSDVDENGLTPSAKVDTNMVAVVPNPKESILSNTPPAKINTNPPGKPIMESNPKDLISANVPPEPLKPLPGRLSTPQNPKDTLETFPNQEPIPESLTVVRGRNDKSTISSPSFSLPSTKELLQWSETLSRLAIVVMAAAMLAALAVAAAAWLLVP